LCLKTIGKIEELPLLPADARNQSGRGLCRFILPVGQLVFKYTFIFLGSPECIVAKLGKFLFPGIYQDPGTVFRYALLRNIQLFPLGFTVSGKGQERQYKLNNQEHKRVSLIWGNEFCNNAPNNCCNQKKNKHIGYGSSGFPVTVYTQRIRAGTAKLKFLMLGCMAVLVKSYFVTVSFARFLAVIESKLLGFSICCTADAAGTGIGCTGISLDMSLHF